MNCAPDVPNYYFRAKALVLVLPPLLVGADLPPGSSDAAAKLDPRTLQGNTLVQIRADFPSPLIVDPERAALVENTVMHECGHPWDTLLELQGRDHHARYWAFRGFPGTWEQAESDALARDAAAPNTGWQFHPRESWAECFGAAMSGRWVKPEKTMNWGSGVDPLAARAFFQSVAGVSPAPITVVLPPTQKATYDIEWLGPVPASNHMPGRSGNPVTLIVDHWMDAPFDSALARFMRDGSEVSAHYLIGQTGRIAQVVRDADTAYHAGEWTTNTLSIGVEHEASPTQVPSDALYAASAWLHAKLAVDHDLDLIEDITVKPHRSIVPTQCPGTLDLARIIRQAEDDMFTDDDRALLHRVKDLLEAEGPKIWTARAQRILDVETGKPYDPNKPALDARIRQ